VGYGDDLFRSTFRASPIGMAILDAEGRYLDLNGGFERILGLRAPSIVGHRFAEFTHPDDLTRDSELLDQLATGGLPFYQVQKRYIDAAGDTVWCRVTVSEVPVDGTPTDARFVAQIEDITEFRRAKDLLERKALYDPLTGLANRTLLLDRLAHALAGHLRRDTTVAVLFFDVDHFNLVNDSLGHEAGDALLAVIGQRVQGAVRAGDTVARLGGDEFVVVLENIATAAAAERVAELVTSAVQSPITVAGHEVVPTISVGLAVADRDVTAESLVRDADTAMYAAKQAGRARIEVFSPDLRESALHKLSIEGELRAAVRDGDLAVYYQPVVDLETRAVIAYEALVRWEHPTRGLLLPGDFIEISEEANLVVPLGAFVLHESCGFLARHPEFTGRMFVNVSTRQIGSADLTRVVKAALDESGVDARRISLEITESGMLMTTKVARADLENIADLGVDLVLDDFGTGYSALASIIQNPVAGLKLSHEFTQRLGDNGSGDRISSAVASLAANLGMYGIAEGIETEDQHRQAKPHGWLYGQGFLYGHPLPESEVSFEDAGRAVPPPTLRKAHQP
jgi:diguanylate cyclase (GGDEF)-like protein/PAS domain S-box-containing protein